MHVNFSGLYLLKGYGCETNGVMTQHMKEMHVKTLLSTSLVFQKKWYASKCCAQDVVSSI